MEFRRCWLLYLGLCATTLAAVISSSTQTRSSVPTITSTTGSTAAAAQGLATDLSSDGISNRDWSIGQPNGPNNRNQWTRGYDITNDTDFVYPNTGRTRYYDFVITNTTCNPDGFGRIQCMLINGQYPGPTILADWGDTVRIRVTNRLQDNGTSFHFHGIQQIGTNLQDGVNGVTECPLAPGKTRVYTWRATQHGSSWYHSHHTSQYGAGVIGPIVIRGPSSANYDIDLGPVIMNEWYHVPGFSAAIDEEVVGIREKRPPNATDNVLINGRATWNGRGQYSKFVFQKGKTHKLRLINTAVNSAFRFSIDGHKLIVIAADLVPVKPFQVDSIMVGISQRYDVLVVANQPSKTYWMRVDDEKGCAVTPQHRGLAVVRYATSFAQVPAGGEPQTPAFPSDCQAPTSIKPVWPPGIPPRSDFENNVDALTVSINLGLVEINHGDLIIWGINGTGLDIQWERPTLTDIAQNTTYPAASAVIELDSSQKWSYWVIQEAPSPFSGGSHPIHLHGHDFYTLGKGVGPFDARIAPLNLIDPPRRDTEYLNGDLGTQQGSWLAIAFRTGNPGAWLLHCHIAGHIAQGFGVQFIDSKEQIPPPDVSYYQGCNEWTDYYKTAYYRKIDSGL